jgi:hypothetical protein
MSVTLAAMAAKIFSKIPCAATRLWHISIMADEMQHAAIAAIDMPVRVPQHEPAREPLFEGCSITEVLAAQDLREGELCQP